MHARIQKKKKIMYIAFEFLRVAADSLFFFFLYKKDNGVVHKLYILSKEHDYNRNR